MRKLDISLRQKISLSKQNSLVTVVLQTAADLRNKQLLITLSEAGFSADILHKIAHIAERRSAPNVFPLLGNNGGIQHLAVFLAGRVGHISRNEALRVIGANALAEARKLEVQKLVFLTHGLADEGVCVLLAEGAWLGDYSFDEYRKSSRRLPLKVDVICPHASAQSCSQSVKKSEVVIGAQNRARHLVNLPPSELGPKAMASVAVKWGRSFELDVEVWGAQQLKKHGLNGILAVGRGADEPPCLIMLKTKKQKRDHFELALVGKAVTFDSGGYCIKQPQKMWQMKGDMAGGAAVIAAMMAIAALEIPVSVVGLIPCAKNLVGPESYLPGDVIRAKNGKTIHVTNTDAEGRLLLADALVLAGEKGSRRIVDVATLTGACVRALGTAVAGIMGNDQSFVDTVIGAGQEVGESFWQLPLVAEYRRQLTSDVADLEHVANSPNAGAIVAGLFLQEFVPESVPWAHLDIAGPFFTDKAWRYYSPGATGFGVRTLVKLAESLPAK